MKSLGFALFTGLMATVSTLTFAAEGQDRFADALLGDWGGVRGTLADRGVDMTLEYKGDVWRNMSGGIKRGNSYMDNLDVKFELDGEKLFGIRGNKSLVYFMNNNGGKTNARQVGSVQGIDNIEVAKNTPRLYEAWTEQSFFDEKLAVLVGIHDLNSEFLVTDMSANFIKPVMQIGQSVAQSGQNGPSIFPVASLAGRVKYAPTEETYFSAAAFDGVPGNPDHPYATRVDYEKGDGLLLIAEGGYVPKKEGVDSEMTKLAVGAWRYTQSVDDLVDVDTFGNPVKRHQQGAYLLTSCRFFQNKEGQAIGGFFRATVADGDTAQTEWTYETGLVGNGWVREGSEIGLGLAQAHNAGKYKTSVAGVADDNEYSMELYYRDTIYRGVTLQPDIQYIVNPGTDRVTKNVTVVGMRVDVNF